MSEGIDMAQAELVIQRIEKIAEAFAMQAGVGGCETAGHLISYLAENPRDIEPLLKFGMMELPDDWIERGQLSHYAQNGKIVRPHQVRQSRVINKLRWGGFRCR